MLVRFFFFFFSLIALIVLKKEQEHLQIVDHTIQVKYEL